MEREEHVSDPCLCVCVSPQMGKISSGPTKEETEYVCVFVSVCVCSRDMGVGGKRCGDIYTVGKIKDLFCNYMWCCLIGWNYLYFWYTHFVNDYNDP